VQSPFYPPCLFKKLTGLNCPGCGSSRALHQLMHGNLLPALDYNILVVIFLPFIVVGILSFFTGHWIITRVHLVFNWYHQQFHIFAFLVKILQFCLIFLFSTLKSVGDIKN
jgi:ABC-type spermidine/putrescine transport system permease subunit II